MILLPLGPYAVTFNIIQHTFNTHSTHIQHTFNITTKNEQTHANIALFAINTLKEEVGSSGFKIFNLFKLNLIWDPLL